MLRFVIFFCAILGLATSQTTTVSQCTANPGDLPINTYISGCTTPPCTLPQLEDCIINVIFRAPRACSYDFTGQVGEREALIRVMSKVLLRTLFDNHQVAMILDDYHYPWTPLTQDKKERFLKTRTIQTMRTLATAFMSIGPITLPVPYDLGENAVTCNFLTNTFCPLLNGEVVQYELRMFIESFFPAGTQTTIEFRVVDQDNTPVLCLRVPVIIAPPRDTGGRKTIVVGDIEQIS